MLNRLYLILVVLFTACSVTVEKTLERNPKEIIAAQGVEIEVYDFENFRPFTTQKDGKLHLINFWATWCIPCVQELPYFEQMREKYPNIEVTLVSLDFLSKVKTGLIPFVIKEKLKSEVIVLHEPDGNKWIPQVDENWSGALPATIIYQGENRRFYEQSFNFEELEQEVLGVMNKPE